MMVVRYFPEKWGARCLIRDDLQLLFDFDKSSIHQSSLFGLAGEEFYQASDSTRILVAVPQVTGSASILDSA